MENQDGTVNQNVFIEPLVPMIKTMMQAELTKVYAYVVKNLRVGVLGLFGFGVLTSSAFFGLSLFLMSLLYVAGAKPTTIATVGMILGGLMTIGAVAFVAVALSQKFWIKTFKLDKMVEEAVEASPAAEGNLAHHGVGQHA